LRFDVAFYTNWGKRRNCAANGAGKFTTSTLFEICPENGWCLAGNKAPERRGYIGRKGRFCLERDKADKL
jgi:hypothetical protein